ncbi:MAG: D-glycero-beta-D-manno-heptose-7-phosphate kinase [Chloroflexi bacterium]|nr:D-glycero-beta-D-manno-heptose-7-phosphate kinase [Chloroflexota bacterium]
MTIETHRPLGKIIHDFRGNRVVVIGDVMLDEYIVGTVARVSPEAPIPVVNVEKVTYTPGGAANVAANVAALGGEVVLCGVVGDDDVAVRLRQEMEKRGVETRFAVDASRTTTLKSRVVAHSQQVVRLDRETRSGISQEVATHLLELVEKSLNGVRAVAISDYGKGLTEPWLMARLIPLAGKGRPLLVDPKGKDYQKYRGSTIITPNEAEAFEATGGRLDAPLSQVMKTILRRVSCQAVLVTQGAKGMSLMEAGGSTTHFPALAREVYDVTGAGDTVVGTLALALTTGASLVEGVRLANHAAGIVVGRVGTVAVTVGELSEAVGDG